MKLRYYADSSFEEDHEGVLSRLRSVAETWNVPVEVRRVRERHGAVGEFPGPVETDDLDAAYERDFKYNDTLSANLGHSPSNAFETEGGLVTIAGSVGVVVEGDLRWATMLSGTPPATHSGRAHIYSISFLDDVLDRGPEALQERIGSDPDGVPGTGADRGRDPGPDRDGAPTLGGDDVVAEFVAASPDGLGEVPDSAVTRDVTVGASTAIRPDMSDGARGIARDVATRTVDAVVEADVHWVIVEKGEFTADTFDAAIGEILLADALYRADEGMLEAETRRAVIFGEFPGGIDLTDQPEMLSFLVGYAKSLEIELFVGVESDRIGAPREFVHVTGRSDIVR